MPSHLRERLKKIPLFSIVCFAVATVLFLYFIYLKWQLAQMRYFDHDELSYLYWATHMQMGDMPYRDFLLYPAPGLLWLLEWVASWFSGFQLFLAGRTLMFGIFVGLTLVLGGLFWEMRKSWIAICVPLLLTFLPLPADKFLEIRPDSLALFFASLGLLIQIRFMNKPVFTRSPSHSLQKTNYVSLAFVGIFYAASLLVSQKMVILVGIASLGFIGWNRALVQKHVVNLRQSLFYIFAVGIGAGLTGLAAFFWFLSLGNFPLVWYSLVKLPFEANELAKLFPIAPDFFFYPNDVVYGTGSRHLGYWLNLLVWVFGTLVAVYRFIESSLTDARNVWQERIVSVSMLLSFYLFIYVMPMKHAQYLIPSAAFVVWYCADGIYLYWKSHRQSLMHRMWSSVVFVGAAYVFFVGYRLVNIPKMSWLHDQEAELHILLQNIPKSEYVLDLECVSLYFPNPYFISCMPIGQVTPIMSLQLPSVRQRLEETNTKYIFEGRYHRTQELSKDDQQYIIDNFTSVGDGKLLVRNDTLSEYEKRTMR